MQSITKNKNQRIKKVFKIFFLAILAINIGCSSETVIDELPQDILIESLVIYGGNITNGSTNQLTVGILPNNATNKEVTWSVLDNTIAEISENGLLTAKENGEVIVKVVANDDSGVSAEKIIKISGVAGPPVLVESIKINGNDITDGKPLQLSVTILPNDANDKTVTWSVSDENIATIDQNGLLTPKENGKITVSAAANDNSGKKGTLEINISGITATYQTILEAENMLLWQRNNGGWPKEPYNDFSGYKRTQTASEINTANNTKNRTDTTIDNDHTVGELRVLLNAYKTTNNPNYLDAVNKALNYLFEAQYSNGGWPQYYPDKSGYRARITFNDNAMVNVMNLMWDITKGKNNTNLLDDSYIAKAKTAFDKGIEVILKTQNTVNGVKTAWCAQHDEVTLQAAKARSYELASNSGSESVGVIRTLMLVENPSTEIKQAVQDAIAWFKDVKILDIATQKTSDDVIVVDAPGNVIWARFYDLNTNLPFFCGRDGIKKNTLAEIERERRTGYSWYGNWPKNLIGSEYNSWKNKHGI
ncbi:pectate lyase [Polaribacter sp.]|uniref:pectate lyase n=1 Tax=Polaribacter sp. TaxID=1920175 RepID=UPI003F6AA28E